jgi:hypothetical protein
VEVLALFPPEAILLYYRTYFPTEKMKYVDAIAKKIETAAPAERDALDTAIITEFQIHFDRRYGRRHFFIPIGLLVLISATLTFLCARFLLDHPPSDNEFKADPTNFTVIMCLAAAYCWVLYDFFSRERSLDFSTTHINWATFRLIISVPLAYAIPTLWSEARIATAFLLGAFPTGLLMTLLRRRAFQSPIAQNLGVGQTTDDRLAALETLPTVNSAVADRFREEGLTTITQLASADPVALAIRTGYDLRVVFDCISEALAWYYLQTEGMQVARTFSIPGALEVYGLIEELDYVPNPDDPLNGRHVADKNLANLVLDSLAPKMKQERPVLERVLRCIWDDSRVKFLADLMDALRAPFGQELPACHGGASVARRAMATLNAR